MSLQSEIDLLAIDIASKIKSDRTKIGGTASIDLSTLATTVKTSLISAINELDAEHGDLTTLSTTFKTHLVGAINEIYATAGAAVTSVNGATGAVVLDTDDIAEGSTNLYYTDARADARVQAAKGTIAAPSTTAWPSTQDVSDHVAAQISALIDSAPGALDTLKELADYATANAGDITNLLTAVGNRLRFDAAQTLTAGEKLQGQTNLDVYSKAEIGDITTDFVATFNAALV